eukprot:9484496-Pyramimonas_sp.AAC.1
MSPPPLLLLLLLSFSSSFSSSSPPPPIPPSSSPSQLGAVAHWSAGWAVSPSTEGLGAYGSHGSRVQPMRTWTWCDVSQRPLGNLGITASPPIHLPGPSPMDDLDDATMRWRWRLRWQCDDATMTRCRRDEDEMTITR